MGAHQSVAALRYLFAGEDDAGAIDGRLGGFGSEGERQSPAPFDATLLDEESPLPDEQLDQMLRDAPLPAGLLARLLSVVDAR